MAQANGQLLAPRQVKKGIAPCSPNERDLKKMDPSKAGAERRVTSGDYDTQNEATERLTLEELDGAGNRKRSEMGRRAGGKETSA